jgi:D-ribose pyranose/furanose isomerase RbsD
MNFLHGEAMNDESLPVVPKGPNALDAVLDPTVPSLNQVPDLSEDEVLLLTRKIRLRQLQIDLNSNEGQLSDDPEVRKVQLAMLKDLDSQAAKIKMIGAKEKATAVHKEAVQAVGEMMRMMGDDPLRRKTPLDGESRRVRPSIKDLPHLKPLEIVPDETQVGVDHTTYEELLERTGHS